MSHAARLLYVVNESYFFLSHRLQIGLAAQRAGYEVHIAAPADHVWAPRDFDGSELTQAGFVLHELPLSRRGQNPLTEARTIAALIRLYRSLRPQMVHHMTIKPVLYGSLAARITGVPAVANLITGLGHLFSDESPRSRVLRRFAVQGYRIAAGHPNSWTTCQNRGDRDRLIAAGALNAARSSVIRGSGVDLETFSPASPPEGVPLVVLPARLLWEKGVGVFVDAARQLQAQGTNARFAIVGDTQPSNPRSVPETTLRAWHDAGIVEWWGRRDDMPSVFSQAHIVCLPSVYGEGVPKVLLEAAAAGRPVVTSDIAGCREVVLDGITGVLAKAGDAQALARALRRLIEDPDLRSRMGSAARALAEAEFAEGMVVAETLAIYRHLRDGSQQDYGRAKPGASPSEPRSTSS